MYVFRIINRPKYAIRNKNNQKQKYELKQF
jgi:hypothetical protein